MNLRRTAAFVAAAGLTAGLVGAGVSASWTDSATAAGTFTVGTLHCAVSSTDPSAVVSGNSVTITAPPILSSAAGNYLTSMTVTNTGSITEVVHWTEATSGTLPANRWSPTGPMGYATGAGSDLLSTDLTLNGGASHTYANGIGFIWANAGGSGVQLGNADEGMTATVTYTANCGEVPAAPASKVQFVGVANEGGSGTANKNTSALALPAGSQVGDYALVLTYGATGGNNAQVPSGYTQIQTSGAGNMQSVLSYRVLVAGDTAVPSQTTGYGVEVAIYRGVAGIGSKTAIGGNLNNVGGASYPLYCGALDGVTGPAMTKTDGSSWVACMGGDGFATTNAKQMVFDSNTVNRSSGNAVAFTGLADTNAGVAAWAKVGWGGDNFVLPGSHGVVVHTVELLSK